jgi:hypothetical protein
VLEEEEEEQREHIMILEEYLGINPSTLVTDHISWTACYQ